MQETDNLMRGTFWGTLLCALILPLIDTASEKLGIRNIWQSIGITFLVSLLVLVVPVALKIWRGEATMKLDEDMTSCKALIKGRSIGIILGVALGAPVWLALIH